MVNRFETVTSSLLIWDRDCSLSDLRQIGVSLPGSRAPGLYMDESREVGFENYVYEIYNNDCMNLEIGWWSYRCGNWLRGVEWYLESRNDGLDLFWTWQRAWNGKWKNAWFLYIYINFKTVVPFRRPYYRTSHCYSELSSRLLRQVVSPHDYLHFCRWSCTGASNRKGN